MRDSLAGSGKLPARLHWLHKKPLEAHSEAWTNDDSSGAQFVLVVLITLPLLAMVSPAFADGTWTKTAFVPPSA